MKQTQEEISRQEPPVDARQESPSESKIDPKQTETAEPEAKQPKDSSISPLSVENVLNPIPDSELKERPEDLPSHSLSEPHGDGAGPSEQVPEIHTAQTDSRTSPVKYRSRDRENNNVVSEEANINEKTVAEVTKADAGIAKSSLTSEPLLKGIVCLRMVLCNPKVVLWFVVCSILDQACGVQNLLVPQ